MSPTISRISFVFSILALSAASGSAQSWKKRLESAAGAAQAAASAPTPEQAHSLAGVAQAELAGEKTLGGIGPVAPVSAPAPGGAAGKKSWGGPRYDYPERRWEDEGSAAERWERHERNVTIRNTIKGALVCAAVGAGIGALVGWLAGGGAGAGVGAIAGGAVGLIAGAILGALVGKTENAVTWILDRR